MGSRRNSTAKGAGVMTGYRWARYRWARNQIYTECVFTKARSLYTNPTSEKEPKAYILVNVLNLSGRYMVVLMVISKGRGTLCQLYHVHAQMNSNFYSCGKERIVAKVSKRKW